MEKNNFEKKTINNKLNSNNPHFQFFKIFSIVLNCANIVLNNCCIRVVLV